MRGRGGQRPVPSTTAIPTRCANGGAWHTVVPSPDRREPPRRSSHLTRPVDIARSGYFSHPRRASRDELASGASRLASTLSRHALLLVFRPVGAVEGPSRVGDSAGFAPARPTRRPLASCSRRRIDDRDFNTRGRLRPSVGACIPQIDDHSDRLVQSRVSPTPTRHAPPPRCFAQLAPPHATGRTPRSRFAGRAALSAPRNGMTTCIQRTGTTRTTDSRCLWPNAISGRECGWRVVTYSSPNRLGLIKPRWKPSSRRGAIGLGEDRPDWRWSRTSVSRVRENRMHGSMRRRGEPAPVGHAARRGSRPTTTVVGGSDAASRVATAPGSTTPPATSGSSAK